MRHSEIPNCARSSSSAHLRCRPQRSHVRHRTPQIFRSQFETKVHNQIRKRVENYVENRSSHVRNPVFYEQICDELLSGFTMITRSGQAERNELLKRGDTPRKAKARVVDGSSHPDWPGTKGQASQYSSQKAHLTTALEPQPLVTDHTSDSSQELQTDLDHKSPIL